MQFEINFLKEFISKHTNLQQSRICEASAESYFALECIEFRRQPATAHSRALTAEYGNSSCWFPRSTFLHLSVLCFYARVWVFENSLSVQHTRRAWTSRCSANYFPMNINSIFRSDFWAIKLILEIPLKYCPSIITRGIKVCANLNNGEFDRAWKMWRKVTKFVGCRLDMIYSKIKICCRLIISPSTARLQCNDLAFLIENSFSQIKWKNVLNYSKWIVIDRDTPHAVLLEEMPSASYVRKCRSEKLSARHKTDHLPVVDSRAVAVTKINTSVKANVKDISWWMQTNKSEIHVSRRSR